MIIKKKQESLVPEGAHEAVLTDIKVEENKETVYGEKNVLYFYFEFKGGQVIKELCFNYYKNGSRLYSFVEGMLGETPEELDLEVCINKRYQLEVVHNAANNGRVYANVETIKGMITDKGIDSNSDKLPRKKPVRKKK